MSISKERIERAVNAVRREAGCGKTCPLEKGCMCRNVTIAALTADAPALLTAKIEEAKEIRAAIEHLASEADEASADEQPFRDGLICAMLAADAHIAELSSQEAGT